ncbi:MAG: hypothetical protein KGL39_29365 [Patescibacteria group bacterium]|nr:hypothetical protein [Patescibacteria group bacterium]
MMAKIENAFLTCFGDNIGYICDGDAISTAPDRDGVFFRATVERDDSGDRPDERQEGFWPTLNPADAGYIGPRSKSTLRRAQARAQRIMDAWRNDEWWYVGVVIRAYRVLGHAMLETGHVQSLWGIECNYPASERNRHPNAYLTMVANDLLAECGSKVRAELARMAAEMLATLQNSGTGRI